MFSVVPPQMVSWQENCALTHFLPNPGQVWLNCGVKPAANNHFKDSEGTEGLAGISKLVTGVARYVRHEVFLCTPTGIFPLVDIANIVPTNCKPLQD